MRAANSRKFVPVAHILAVNKRLVIGAPDTAPVPASERVVDRGTAAGMRQLQDVGGEFRERRMSLGESQAFVAAAARLSRPRYSRIESGAVTTLSLTELNRIAAVLGLAASVRVFPGGVATRDAGHTGKLGELLRHVRPPLAYRIEVALPQAVGRWEQRAWDAVLFGNGERTAIELEMRLRDVQAVRRRHEMKRRDDPTEHFLLLVADTRHNRRVLAEYDDVFAEIPRRKLGAVRAALAVGKHPPTGLLLV
jgi:transcriptional regulator with XRE-family HTH domain